MVTITTEDGRILKYETNDLLTIVGHEDYRHVVRCRERRACNVQVGDYVWIQGTGRNPERDPDLARVTMVSQ